MRPPDARPLSLARRCRYFLQLTQGILANILHADHLGSTVAATQAGATTAHKYKAFGANRSAGDVHTDHLFTGQKQDGTGLLYYRARYYDKLLGTFISPDALIPDAGNVFARNSTSPHRPIPQ